MNLLAYSGIILCILQTNKGFEISREKRAKGFESDKYLEKFGYLDEAKGGRQHDETSRKYAISEFQEFAGIRVTGQMNEETLARMLAPRCGLPDVIRPGDRIPPNARETNRNKPSNFYAPGFKWDKNEVTYKFVGFSRQLPQSSQRRAIRNAFSKWSAVTPLQFRESSGAADILINWVFGDHGDGSPFDRRGGTLAHAFFPGTSAISGDTHFDEAEEWTEGKNAGTNLEIVAAHEFGHAIGLSHSNVRGALMQPFYGGYDPNYQLQSDDIRGVQTLYGSAPRPQPRPQPTRAPPATTPRDRDSGNNPDKEICELKFDDIANGPDNRLYAFRFGRLYKFNYDGVGIEKVYKNSRRVFPKAPKNIAAAAFDRRNNKFYIFKGYKLWRYSQFTLDAGYPKRLQGWYRNVDAAIVEDSGEILLLKGKEVSVWREDFASPPRGYPVAIGVKWPGLRDDLEAAVRYRRISYFFKGANYFRYNDYNRKVDYRKSKAGPWLGCGRPEPK
ncbi:macrophage metalloelastase-like [Mya arenaria]|uniref:macrophage metalloelastase-like n=1 Tax=Mya arenaria TaxID=6604 RepID=UPI0022E38710|nr:macrophage metalloelastase-like [Mya arenaria]